jgi:hypothetical protein
MKNNKLLKQKLISIIIISSKKYTENIIDIAKEVSQKRKRKLTAYF